MEHWLENEYIFRGIYIHINEISLSESETEKEKVLEVICKPMNEDESKRGLMVEESTHGEIDRNLKDTEKEVKKNDEELTFIQTEINVLSIMRIMINENETIFSWLGRKSAESGTGEMIQGENARGRRLMAKNSKLTWKIIGKAEL